MKHLSIPMAMRSIRTKFGLVTACILLGLLLAFYLGGRFILVHMIREAEKTIQIAGNDIKSIVYNEIGNLKRDAAELAETLSRSGGDVPREFLESQMRAATGSTPVNLAIVIGANGLFKQGCLLIPGEPPSAVQAADVQPYLSSLFPIQSQSLATQGFTGVIALLKKPLFIAVAPVKDSTGTVTGFALVGSLLHNSLLINRINEATHGMQVAVSDRPNLAAGQTSTVQHAGIAPVFQDALNYYSGGRWHLGDNAFEAVMPIHDILGKEVTSIALRLPHTFSSIASIALGWLTFFVATIGIIFVLPIFWLQTRILLDPLTRIADQIHEIGENHLDGECTTLNWPQKDEFGMLARSVNGMIEALSLKTRQIHQIEQRQRALIAGMPDCLCVFDTFAHLISVHKQPDYSNPIPGLIAGRPIAPPIFPESDCDTLRQAIAETFRSGNTQMVIISCREADGSYRHFETRISRMDACFALVVLRDVTKEWHEREMRAQMEDRLAKIKKIESLGNLAASIAHDFNNILAIIQNTIEVTWPKTGTEAAGGEAVNTIRQAANKGAALTRELMTYAGQARIEFKHDDPNRFILDLEKLMGGVIAPNVALELKLTPGLPYVDADPHQFWKIIINLLKNASESMNGARGHIRLSTYPHELTEENIEEFFSTHELATGSGVVFQIDDTGSGMSREVISRIFEPFFSTKAFGRGLGLSTVFGIVDAHNGGIAIDSEVGKGTSFRIWFPVSKDQSGAPRPTAAPAVPRTITVGASASEPPAAPAAPAAARPSVLLVEDDPAILQTTTLVLRSLSADTLQAATKREALLLFRKHADTINLVLMDSQLGHLDNVRLLAALRMRNPEIPIVIVSGHTETKIREMFASEPFDGFLSKPYTRGDIGSILQRFASKKREV